MAIAVGDVLRPVLSSVASLLQGVTNDLQSRLVSAGLAAAKPAAAAADAVLVVGGGSARRPSAAAVATAFAVLGAATLVSWAVTAADFLSPYVRPSRLRRFNRAGQRRPWAVVTGASDGIGKGFAQELAAAGFNVVLVARDEDKLADVARGIEYEFPGASTRVLVTDAGRRDQASFLAKLDATVAALPGPVTVLVNNVGRANAHVDVLARQDDYDLADVVVVNDVFPILITKRLLPTLERNQPSLILNVGSYASETAVPHLAVFCGSKAFIKTWSESLHSELRMAGGGAAGVECQHLLVDQVHSGSNRTPVGLFCPDARTFARAALRVSTRRPVVTPYFPHALYFGIFRRLPSFVSDWLVRRAARELKRKADKPVYVVAA